MGKRGLAAVLAASISGCSLAFVQPPPVRPTSQVSCTTGYRAPQIDVSIATVLAVFTVAYLAGEGVEVSDQQITFGVTALSVAAWFGGSGYYGFTRARRCREARASARYER